MGSAVGVGKRTRLAAAILVALLAMGVAAAQGRLSRPAVQAVRAAAGVVKIEGESLVGKAATSSGQVGKQDMQSFGHNWSGNAQLFWSADAPSADLRFQITVPASGRYSLAVFHTQGPDFGRAALSIDGNRLGSFDGYNQSVKINKAAMAEVELAKGTHNVVITVFGKNDLATNFFVGLDKLELSLVGAAAGPARGGGKPKQTGLSPQARLARSLDRSREQDPLLPVVMQTIQRGLELPATERTSAFDQAFDAALARHPNVSREMLQKLVADYQAVPEKTRARSAPRAFVRLNVAQPVDPSALAAAVADAQERSQRPKARSGGEPGSPGSTSKMPLSVSQKSGLSAAVLEAMTKPMIIHLEPEAPQGYDPEQTVTLVGQGFSAKNAENKVIFLEVLADGSAGQSGSVSPLASSQTAVKVSLGGLTPGHYYVQVESKVTGSPAKSNLVDFYIKTPPPPAPVIQSISPSQYAGKKALIEGQHLKAGSPIDGVWFMPMENQPLLSYQILNGDKVAFAIGKVLSNTQVEVTIPALLMAGKYQVVTEVPGAGMSAWVPYEVRAYRYKVDFRKMHCKDESDPETFLFTNPGDEIVTMWVVAADDTAWSKNSGEYVNFDDGDNDWYNTKDRSVFCVDGQAGSVKKILAIETTLYEWDAGDVESANEVIGYIGDLAAIGLGATGQVEGVALAKALTPVIQTVVSWLGGDPDNLGTRQLAWSSLDLLEQTNNPEAKFAGTLNFDNDDDTGSYSLTYEVSRFEQ